MKRSKQGEHTEDQRCSLKCVDNNEVNPQKEEGVRASGALRREEIRRRGAMCLSGPR